jgi:hypothetical protein
MELVGALLLIGAILLLTLAPRFERRTLARVTSLTQGN